VLQCVTVCCSVLQCVAVGSVVSFDPASVRAYVCCSVLQCVAVCCSVSHWGLSSVLTPQVSVPTSVLVSVLGPVPVPASV